MEQAGDKVLRLKTVIEATPGALARLLQLFDERSVIPRRVSVQRFHLPGTNRDIMQISIELTTLDLTLDAMRFIAAKTAQMPGALSTIFGEARAE